MVPKRIFALLLALLLTLTGCDSWTPAPSAPPAEGTLTVHYLDVGQADAALLVCGGEAMLIDGGNVDDSQFLYSYLTQQGISELSAVVCTHCDEDHCGGLSAALVACTAQKVYCSTDQYDSRAFQNFVKKAGEQGQEILIPSPGDSFSLGGAQVEFLAPLQTYSDNNNNSIVTMVTFGTTKFLFTGDMETEAEADLLAGSPDLSATVLKVGHHGSETSTSEAFLQAVSPAWAVISVGKDNSYGHPSPAVLDRLEDAGITVYRTDRSGTVICTSDGTELSFSTETDRPAAAPSPETPAPAETSAPSSAPSSSAPDPVPYVGNRNSLKFHLPSCEGVASMKEGNKVFFDTREEALEAGYVPCKSCNP